MPNDKPYSNDNVSKQDLELILSVNKKTIEVQLLVSEQNETIIDGLKKLENIEENVEKLTIDTKDNLEKLTDKIEEINRDLFKIQILFLTGIIGIVTQIISFFLKK